jgi:predicted MFS family arabinose efflux permease
LDKKEKILLFILASIQFTSIMDFMIMMPLGPQLMRIFQINPQEFGFLVSAYTFAAGFSSFIGVFWIDNFDRKKALMNMYLGFLLGTLACALSPTYTILVLSRILTGLFGGLLMALVFSIIGDVIEEKRRGTAMGYVSTSFSLASVLGVPFGLFIASFWNWHAPFFFLRSRSQSASCS